MSTTTTALTQLQREIEVYAGRIQNLDFTVMKYRESMARMTEVHEDVQQSASKVADKVSALDQIFNDARGLLQSVTHGFEAYLSICELTGTENEKLETVLKKLQATMALLKSVQGMAGLVDSFSSFTTTIKTSSLGVNAFGKALISTGIGAIVVAIGMLIANFEELKEELYELVPELKELEGLGDMFNTAVDAVKAFGRAMVKYYLMPLKSAIAFVRAYKEKGIRAALAESAEEVRDGLNVIGNTVDTFHQNQSKRYWDEIQAQRRKRDEDRLKDLENEIDFNSRKYGNDWQYTEEAFKLYQDMFDKKLGLYEEDSEEYKKILQDREIYEHKFVKKQEDNRKKTAENARRIREQQEEEEKKEKERLERYDAELAKIQDNRIEREKALAKSKTEGQERLGYIEKEITANKKLQAGLLRDSKDEKLTIEERTEALQKYQEILQQGLQLEDELYETSKEVRNHQIAELKEHAKLDYIEAQVKANKKLQDSLKFSLEAEELTDEQKIRLEKEYQRAVKDGIELNKLSHDVEKGLKVQNEQLTKQMDDARGERREKEKLSLQEKLSKEKEEFDLQKEKTDELWNRLETEELTFEKRQELLNEYNEELKKQNALEKVVADTKDKIEDQKKKALKSTLDVTKEVLSSATELLGQETVAGKAMAVAGATISTYQSATDAYKSMAGIPVIGPALGAAAAAAAVASGLANVKEILKTDIPGVSDSSASSVTSAAIPAMPELQNPIQETHNNMDSADEDFFNQSSKVYVVESDISSVQKRVQVVESEVSF